MASKLQCRNSSGAPQSARNLLTSIFPAEDAHAQRAFRYSTVSVIVVARESEPEIAVTVIV